MVRFAPDPLNPVAVRMPVDGLNWYLVDDVNTVAKLPAVWFANNGYLVAFVVVSSVTVDCAEAVAHEGADVPLLCRTFPASPAADARNAVVPVAD